jgi:hypothetical protein
MRRDMVHYRSGQAIVRGPEPRLGRTMTDLVLAPSGSEDWEGPVQELRARLRDEARDRRVKPWGDILTRPGLPRGWAVMRVYLTDTRPVQRKRRTWPWVVAAVGASLSGMAALGWWLWVQTAALLAGATVSGLVGAGVVVALLMFAAGGTTVVTVVTKVTVRR